MLGLKTRLLPYMLSIRPLYGAVLTGGTHGGLSPIQHSDVCNLPRWIAANLFRHLWAYAYS